MTVKGEGAPGRAATAGEFLSVLNAQNLDFYKRNFVRMLSALLLSFLVIIALSIALAYAVQKASQGKRDYFLVEPKTGRMMPIPAMGDPFVTDGALLTWATECVTQANTFNYVEFRSQFERMRPCFTERGWEQFVEAVNRAGSLKLATEGRLIVSSNAAGAAIIVNKGKRGLGYAWEVQLPIVVTYQGGQAGRKVVSSNQVVTLIIERVSTALSERGVGIASYVAEER